MFVLSSLVIVIAIEGAVVRAGLNANHSENSMCRLSSTLSQASTNNWVEFICDPPVLARYVSVDIPRRTSLTLCEVAISPCQTQPIGNFTGDMTSRVQDGCDRCVPYALGA